MSERESGRVKKEIPRRGDGSTDIPGLWIVTTSPFYPALLESGPKGPGADMTLKLTHAHTHTHTYTNTQIAQSLLKQLDKDIICHGCQLTPLAFSTTTPKCTCTPARARGAPEHTPSEMKCVCVCVCVRACARWLESHPPTSSKSHGQTHIRPSLSSLYNGRIETSSVTLNCQLSKHSRPAVLTHTYTHTRVHTVHIQNLSTHTRRLHRCDRIPSHIVTFLSVNTAFTWEQHGVRGGGGVNCCFIIIAVIMLTRMSESWPHTHTCNEEGHAIGLTALP